MLNWKNKYVSVSNKEFLQNFNRCYALGPLDWSCKLKTKIDLSVRASYDWESNDGVQNMSLADN